MNNKLLLNPFLRIYPDLHGGLFILENGLNGERITIEDLQIIETLRYASDPTSRNFLERLITFSDKHRGRRFFQRLIDKGFLLGIDNEIIAIYKDFMSKYSWQDFFLAIKDGERNRARINKKIRIDASKNKQYKFSRQDFFDKLLRRRTTRNFNGVSLDKKSFKSILSDGVDFYRFLGGHIIDSGYIRVFIVVLRVDNLERGIYEYDYVKDHLRAVELGNFEKDLQQIVAGQSFMRGCSFAMLITANVNQLVGMLGISYADLVIEIGKLSHSVLVVATQSELGVFQTPAIIDSKAQNMLKTSLFIDDAFYILGVGYKANQT